MEKAKKRNRREALPLAFCILLLIGIMIFARLLRGDFTKVVYAHAPIQTELEQYVVEKNGRALININRADADMLMMLDGIGEVIAGRIIEYREQNGAFDSLEELLEVKGIGEKTLEKMKTRIVCIPEEESESVSFLEIVGELFD